MGYAIELFYDLESEQSVRNVWDGIGKALGKPSLWELGARPHVSLAVYNADLDTTGFEDRLREFATSVEPFELRMSSVGTFPGSEGVVFLSPVVTRQLLGVHERYHKAFSRYDAFGSAYYLPGNWMPHCTVAIDLTAPEIKEAVAFCREAFQPITGQLREIGLVEFRPVVERFTSELG